MVYIGILNGGKLVRYTWLRKIASIYLNHFEFCEAYGF